MHRVGADGGGCPSISTGINCANPDCLLNQRANKGPTAHIHWLVLYPDHFAGFVYLSIQLAQRGGIEGVELLNPYQGRGRVLALGTLGFEVVVNFTRAEDEAFGFGRWLGVGEEGVETTLGKLLKLADARFVT